MKSFTVLSVVAVLACCCSLTSAQDSFFFPDYDDTPIMQPSTQPPTVPPPTVPPPTAATQSPATSAPISQAPTTAAAPTSTTASPAYIACLASCPTTSEYNPVCGSDLISYNNRQRITCANLCGPRVNQQWIPVVLLRRGMCTPIG